MSDSSLTRAGIPPPGFRLPPTTRLGCIRLQIADLERSLAFYCELLGFEVIDRHGPWGGKRATLGAPGDRTPLIELREKRGARAVPRRGLLGLYHVAVLLPSRDALGAFITRADAAGLKPGMADHGYSQSLYLNDPDGLGIEIYADQPRDTWVYREREIVGRVDPLDADRLVILGEHFTWTGLPPGTTIGHVHLFIGDLDAGARFYHEGLGFDKVGWSFPGALFVSAGGYHHHIGMNTWAAGAPPASDDDARLIEWELQVHDAPAVAASLQRAGITTTTDADAFLARDAWGTAVRIIRAAD
jgi:catechol 2,3-dioxygenase